MIEQKKQMKEGMKKLLLTTAMAAMTTGQLAAQVTPQWPEVTRETRPERWGDDFRRQTYVQHG